MSCGRGVDGKVVHKMNEKGMGSYIQEPNIGKMGIFEVLMWNKKRITHIYPQVINNLLITCGLHKKECG